MTNKIYPELDGSYLIGYNEDGKNIEEIVQIRKSEDKGFEVWPIDSDSGININDFNKNDLQWIGKINHKKILDSMVKSINNEKKFFRDCVDCFICIFMGHLYKSWTKTSAYYYRVCKRCGFIEIDPHEKTVY